MFGTVNEGGDIGVGDVDERNLHTMEGMKALVTSRNLDLQQKSGIPPWCGLVMARGVYDEKLDSVSEVCCL